MQVAAAEQEQAVTPGDRMSPAEMMELLSHLFEQADVDGSGALSLAEFKVRARSGPTERGLRRGFGGGGSQAVGVACGTGEWMGVEGQGVNWCLNGSCALSFAKSNLRAGGGSSKCCGAYAGRETGEGVSGWRSLWGGWVDEGEG